MQPVRLPPKAKRVHDSPLWASFDYAFQGILYATRTQRNMRIHLVAASLALFAALYLRLERAYVAVVVIAIVLATSGCANEVILARPGESKITAAPVPAPPPALVIASELRSACDMHERDGAVFTKIAFDESILTKTDIGALEQLATCFTTGPMKDRTLTLSRREDPPGERRANAAQGALVTFGMSLANVKSTPRSGTKTDRDIGIDVEAIR